MYRRPFNKGRLIVSIDVQFPPNNFLSAEKLKELRKYLPSSNSIEDIPEDAEKVDLYPFNPERDNQHRERRGEVYDDDDTNEPGNHRVQCASS